MILSENASDTQITHRILKQYFGHDTFRAGQEPIIDALLSGRDTLCIMPTGAGKSMCYQIPALAMQGITVIVSPLISLMKDQVTALVQAGVPAAYLNSSLTPRQYMLALERLSQGRYKLVYVAPERLMTPNFLNICASLQISMLAVDEAHCVSQWGQDFRPAYLQIAEFLAYLEKSGKRPVVGAFTATATDTVKADIIRFLGLKTPYSVTTGFDRPNLYFGVIPASDKDRTLLSLLDARREQAGIIYCATRKTVETVCSLLLDNGFPATRYHAGLPEEERQKNQEDFVFDRKRIMVATNAFGMGIDKSDVSFVLHYNMPKNMESYYQEAGRAGRDGSPAVCILLYSPQDVILGRYFIENGEPNPAIDEETQKQLKERDFARLRSMESYCTSASCLRARLLAYFGEHTTKECGNCSVCRQRGQWEERDCTDMAIRFLTVIRETGERFGLTLLLRVARGDKSTRICELNFDKLPSFGSLRTVSEADIRCLAAELQERGFLFTDGDKYPVLRLIRTADSPVRSLLSGNLRFSMRLPQETYTTAAVSEKVSHKKKGQKEALPDSPMMKGLRLLRSSIAMRNNVPAYTVFHDKTLADMCLKQPRTKEEFLEVEGVGQMKADKYAEAFLRVICLYRDK